MDRRTLLRIPLALTLLSTTSCGIGRPSEAKPSPNSDRAVLMAKYPECVATDFRSFLNKLRKGDVPPRPITLGGSASQQRNIKDYREGRRESLQGLAQELARQNSKPEQQLADLREFLLLSADLNFNFIERDGDQPINTPDNIELVRFFTCDVVAGATLPENAAPFNPVIKLQP